MTNKDIITFERKADFIKSCMIKDYLDIIPGNYSFQKTDIDSYLVTDNISGSTFTLDIVNGQILSNQQNCLETMKSAYDNDPEILQAIQKFENDWCPQPKEQTVPGRTGSFDASINKIENPDTEEKHTYLLTMITEEASEIEIQLTESEYETVQKVFQIMNEKCHCGNVYIEEYDRVNENPELEYD